MSQEISFSSAEIIQQIKFLRLTPKITKEIARHKIICETAQAQNITLSEAEVQQAADTFRLQNNLSSSEVTLNWLQKYNLSLEEFEELIYYNSLSLKLAQHLYGDRVEPYFYEHQLDYTKARIHEIVLTDFDLAMELFYGIQELEFSFWDVAHQYIQEPELRYRGGYRGSIKRSKMKPEISMAVFSASPPQVLKPIQIDKKTYLILVSELIEPKLNSEMRYSIITDLFNQWLEGEIKQLEITAVFS